MRARKRNGSGILNRCAVSATIGNRPGRGKFQTIVRQSVGGST
jgi:hypothetical protein